MFLSASSKPMSQEIALPQHTCDLKIIVVWNTIAARVHLNNQNPTWLQDLASDVPEATWFVKVVSNEPILNARHAQNKEMLKASPRQETNCQGPP
eukprot:1140347-Pelagomonas_calceolata.AAC.2